MNFNERIKQLTPATRNHSGNFNLIYNQLLENTIFNKESIGRINSDIVSIDSQIETINEDISRVDNSMGEINNRMLMSSTYLTYEMFGAKGDGLTDDSKAIKDTHNYANEHGLSVMANGSKTYYMHGSDNIEIMTNVNFNGATFIVNDVNITTWKNPLFRVCSKKKPITISDFSGISIGVNTRKIPQLAGHGECLVSVFNENKNQFNRYGDVNEGLPQRDTFTIDDKGNVLNDIIWDFEEITSITLYPIDDEVLVIQNGNFITIQDEGNARRYYERGFIVNRSRVVFENMSHSLKDEKETGEGYAGFIHGMTCSKLTIKDCKLKPRIAYSNENSTLGSYDLRLDEVVEITLDRVEGSDFEGARWGVMTSNFVKDVKIYNSKLNRIDAHCGVWNLTVRDTRVCGKGILLIGGGKLYLENVESYGGASFITLRDDYGSNWNGDIYIKNCKFIANPRYTPKIIDFRNDGTKDFGYQCYYGKNITIEGLEIDDTQVIENLGDSMYSPICVIWNDKTRTGDTTDPTYIYPYIMPKKIHIKDMFTTSSRGFDIFLKPTTNCYCDKDFIYKELNVINDLCKTLEIQPNMDIVLDNIELAKIDLSVIDYTTGQLFGSIQNNRVEGDNFHTYTKRVLPRVEFNNCKDVLISTLNFPLVLNFNNCTINGLLCEKFGSRIRGSANNCTFEAIYNSETQQNSIVKLNYGDFAFSNCYFAKPKLQDGSESSLSLEEVSQIYEFINKMKTFYSRYSKAYVKMVNCTMYKEFDWDTFDPSLKYCEFSFGNHNMNYYPAKMGETIRRPRIEEGYIVNGFTFYDTKINKFIIWNGENWIDLTGEIV